MTPVLKWVLISFGCLVALLIVAYILYSLIKPPAGTGPYRYPKGNFETVQTAIQTLMVDNDIDQVTPSTSGVGGEKISSTSTQFHPTITMSDYMDGLSTTYCYRWDTTGRITFQYDYDDAGNCAADTDQLYP